VSVYTHFTQNTVIIFPKEQVTRQNNFRLLHTDEQKAFKGMKAFFSLTLPFSHFQVCLSWIWIRVEQETVAGVSLQTEKYEIPML